MTPCIEVPSNDRHYPRRRANGRLRYVHRLTWEAVHGRIPDGLTIDHLCFNRRCINLDHLEVVTASENTRRAWANHRENQRCAVEPGVSSCMYGHAPNWIPQRRGFKCRTCHRDKARERRAIQVSKRARTIDASPHHRRHAP